jgi:hypothetical protein
MTTHERPLFSRIFQGGLRAALMALAGLVLALFGSGCAVLGAATNPKVSWALGDPAPMTVVVRRVDVAEDTAKHVDRLMMATPVDDDSAWPKKTAPEADLAKTQAEAIAKRDMYAQTGSRVVPAEVWSQSLASVAPAPGPTPTAQATLTAADVPAGAAKPGKKPKPDPKGKKKETPAPAAPPPPPPAASAKYASLLAVVDAPLMDKYAAVMAKKRAIGDATIEIAQEEAALGEKNVPDADKAAHKEKIAGLEKKVEAMEAEAKGLQKELVQAVSAASAKASPEVRERYGVAFVNLRQAVEDAEISNGAAALRYPLAVPTLLQSTEEMVHVYVADVIEEKTGKRPETRGLQPGVTLEGGKVQITLNGLSPDDMGKLSIGDVLGETSKRTQAWVSRALGLLGTISANKEVLAFERDVLDAVLVGWKAGGWNPPPSPVIPVITPPRPAQPPQAKRRKA